MNEQLSLASEDAWIPMTDGADVSVSVAVDPLTTAVVEPFDYAFTGTTTFTPAVVPSQLPRDFGVGVIVGASGSGKSTMLREFGAFASPEWADRLSIAAHFASPDEAAQQFAAVGLNAVPTWTKPYRVLSTGERFRADLARSIGSDAVIDEFTSVVDRNVAMGVSASLRRHVETLGIRRLVIATCHRDVLPWLQPDWVIDLDIRCWALRPRECLQRPELVVEIYAGSRAAWDVFSRHHYLTSDIHQAARPFIAVMNGHLVGFVASLPFPNGYIKNGWRAHRSVVLPDFQGLGIGVGLSDWVAEFHTREGRRYFSRTAHPRMIAHRRASGEWRETSHSGEQRIGGGYRGKRWDAPTRRAGTSHEFVA